MSERQQSKPLSRARAYGVGKEIGGAIYVHRLYEDILGELVEKAKKIIPEDFAYTVVKLQRAKLLVSFIHSPDFDDTPEPMVGTIYIVRRDGVLSVRKPAADPYIYHHKWLFVKDDYTGFDVEASKSRSATWTSLSNVDPSRIGRMSFWRASVLPQLMNGVGK